MANDKFDEFQKHARQMLRAQQEAYLAAAKQWQHSLAAGQKTLHWPSSAEFDTLPSAAELSEATQTFTSKLLADQQQFMEALAETMNKKPEGKS